jgi:tetratricopeptide (TPR) repeat protein
MKHGSGDANNDAIKEQISAFESALESGSYLYLDVEEIIDMLKYYNLNQQIDEAKKLIDYGLGLHPDDTELLIELAYNALDRNNLPEAKQVAAEIKETDSADVIILNMEILLNEGKLSDAEKMLDRLSPSDKQARNVVSCIAEVFNNMGFFHQALKWLGSVENLYGDNKAFTILMADTYANLNDTEKAIELFNKIIDEDPYNDNVWLKIAQCHHAAGDFKESIEACEFAIAANEENGSAYAVMGNAFMELENYDKAKEAFHKAIEYHGIIENAGHAFLGFCHNSLEEHEEACKEFEKAIEMREDDPEIEMFLDEIYLNYAVSLAETGHGDKAVEICDRIVEDNKTDITVIMTALNVYIACDKQEKVSAIILESQKMIEDEAEFDDIVALSEALNEHNMLDESIRVFMIIVRKLNYNPSVLASAARCFLLLCDLKNFCRYNKNASVKVKPTEAYHLYCEACEQLSKEKPSFDEFRAMLTDAEKMLRIEQEEKNKRGE